MAAGRKKNDGKKVTRYTHENVKEPRTPETGHTSLLPDDEQVVTLPMDNGWSKAISVGKLPEGDDRPVVLDMDPAADPVLFWSGKRNRREVPVLPLQRNEIVSESRIAQIIERARNAAESKSGAATQSHLFADLEKTLRESDRSKRVEFYTHDEGWKNKLICGDSLHVMESLLHYEGMRGKVQMIYMDPPYGIRYGANIQQRVDSTTIDDQDRADEIVATTAYRDTWVLGPHSYLSYLQARLYLCRELLSQSGSIFVQINDENLHRVRVLLDEVFGHDNFVSQIMFLTTSGFETTTISSVGDFLLWYARDRPQMKSRTLFEPQEYVLGEGNASWVLLPDGSHRGVTAGEARGEAAIPEGARPYAPSDLQSQGAASEPQPFTFQGRTYLPGANSHWKPNYPKGMERLAEAGRLHVAKNSLRYRRFFDDFPYQSIGNMWVDTQAGNYTDPKVYVVQTNLKVAERCQFLSTDPGDLVLDPTCGRGTTAIAAERLGRRWITCDTSRVAINIARRELLSRVFDHFVTRNGRVGSGLSYRTVSKISLRSIAKGMEPEPVEFVDKPITDPGALRVTGPFEVLSLGRYSLEDWKGSVIRDAGPEPAKLENYIEVICRLYRKGAAVQGATGLVHAIAEAENDRIAISVGPLTGRVTAKQIHDAVQDAMSSGILEVHVLGWAFEANVGEVKSQLEKRGKVKIELIMIRPDTLAEGLKVTQPEMLFSPLALPDIDLQKTNGHIAVRLNGVALFDRKRRSTEYKAADSGYVSAWYLDEDYDGDCFVDCQMFFDFKKVPNIKAALRAEVEPDEFKLKLTSEPFKPRGYKRIAVKVVDVYGNESTVVRDL
jgi:adenine-specific DNA-methyltransferase